MPDGKPSVADPSPLRERALSRWDDEGGALRGGPQEGAMPGEPRLVEEPRLSNAELVHLRVRVIALENLVLALLAEGPDRQIAVAREMAAYISPRPGCTHHPLTIHAASHMIDLLQRAGCFRTGDVKEPSLDREEGPDG
jgi:hypothetical protein